MIEFLVSLILYSIPAVIAVIVIILGLDKIERMKYPDTWKCHSCGKRYSESIAPNVRTCECEYTDETAHIPRRIPGGVSVGLRRPAKMPLVSTHWSERKKRMVRMKYHMDQIEKDNDK